MAYRPTSLDFINRPNPVEPHTDPHKHPLNAEQHHLRLLHDTSNVSPGIGVGEPSRKRRKSDDGSSHALGRPTLPEVRQQSEKRLRIPPTLSGLHQPPPDAGILPSISVNGLRSVELPERNAAPAQPVEPAKIPALENERPAEFIERTKAAERDVNADSAENAEVAPKKKQTKPRKNKIWTDAETKCLLKGVERHGIGSWTKILKDPVLQFDERRSALDLKDRFRVCCPDQYRTMRKAKPSAPIPADSSSQIAGGEKPKRSRMTHRKTRADLNDLGIKTSFVESGRRKRTAYSEEEDAAILEGFRKYGQKWLQIQQDEDLGLELRRPMDLRDRMRYRWPEEYAKAGLKTRTEKNTNNEGKGKGEEKGISEDKDVTASAQSSTQHETQHAIRIPIDVRFDKPASAVARFEREKKEPTTTAAPAKKMTTPFLNQADDVFWGLPLDAEEERVTLDRRILDWPLDNSMRNPTTNSNIDPLSTLNLPRPNALPAVATGTAFPTASSTAATLPSLATVTAGSLPFDFGEQMELPSLLEGFGALEDDVGDGRPGGQLMPSLDELLG